MKLNSYISMALWATLGLCAASCSILDRSPKHIVQGSDGRAATERTEVTSSDSASGPVLTPPKSIASKSKSKQPPSGGKAVKNKKKKKGGKNSKVLQSELDDVRREVAAGTDGDTAAKDRSGSKQNLAVQNAVPTDFSIGGEWIIYSVRGNIVTGEERPYITFDLPAKRFYGSNGCNIINGDLTMDDKGGVRFENIITTMRMCSDAPFEYLINLAVSDVKSYVARQEGTVTFLDLNGADGRPVMVLRRHNMDFLNGAWKITELNGVAMTGDKDATMTINIPDMKIHGTTGCNIFNGELFIDPDKINSMQFLNIATMHSNNSPESRETEFLLGLECVETARLIGSDTIAMFDTDGNRIFEMTRIRYEDEGKQ